MKQSWGVLRRDKELALFPVISGIVSLVVMAGFAYPIFQGVSDGGLITESTTSSGEVPLWVYPVAFLFYVVAALITIYFNSALIAAAMIRLRGGDPTLKDGLRWANQHIGAILAWALVTATVGFILRALQERLGLLGDILAGLAGIAWQLITYFVIPVILFENAGTFQGIKRSASLFKSRWGEQVVGNASIGIASFLLSIPGITVIVLGAFMSVGGGAVLGVPLILLGVVYLIALAVITQSMQGIYNAALYKFATEGDAGGIFSADQLADAFVHRKGRGRAFRGFPWSGPGAGGTTGYGSQGAYNAGPAYAPGAGYQTYQTGAQAASPPSQYGAAGVPAGVEPVAPAGLPPGFAPPAPAPQPTDRWQNGQPAPGPVVDNWEGQRPDTIPPGRTGVPSHAPREQGSGESGSRPPGDILPQ